MWMIQTLMILFPPLIDRGRQAAHVKLFWAVGSFSRSGPPVSGCLSLLLPPYTLFLASVTSLQDGDKCNAKDMKRSGSELATAVHWSAVRNWLRNDGARYKKRDDKVLYDVFGMVCSPKSYKNVTFKTSKPERWQKVRRQVYIQFTGRRQCGQSTFSSELMLSANPNTDKTLFP